MKEEATFVTKRELESMDEIELNSISNANDANEYLNNDCAANYLQASSIIVMLLGLLVSVLNIIFMTSGNLNTISVGEGIIGGLVYIVTSLIVL